MRFALAGNRPAGAPRDLQSLVLPMPAAARAAVERIGRGESLETLVLLAAGLELVLARLVGYGEVAVHVADLGRAIGVSTAPAQTVRELVAITDDAVAAPTPAGLGANVALSVDDAAVARDDHDLVFAWRERGAVLRIGFDAGRFTPWLARSLGECYLRALAQLGGPECALDAVALVASDERARLLGAFQGPVVAAPPWSSIAERFERVAASAPERVAVVCDEHAVRYGELAARSRALAAQLHARHGIGPGDRVVVCLPKSIDAIVAIVGVVRAGAAWVPIAPHEAAARRRMMLDAIAPAVTILESRSLLELSDAPGELLAIDLGLDHADDTAGAGAASLPRAQPDDLAYAIFTSGSSGVPKAVGVTGRAILNYIDWKLPYYDFDASSVALQLAPLSFDSSVSDLLSMLLAGGALVLVREDERATPEKLAALIAQHRVTTFAIVPSLYALVIDALTPVPSLRVVTVAGERMTRELVRAHHRRLGGVRLINEYGPTECAVCVSAHELGPESGALDALDGPGADPPIGAPIANARAYIVDGQRALLPIGVAGELYVGGAGLARGYLGDDELTAERFVADPFAPGARMYRTGDRARWRADGALEFLGRLDEQVKIRGNRVDLGEVESALLRDPAVQHAAVAARAAEAGELCAWVVGDVDLAALRRRVAASLPDYMVPSWWMRVPALPLNANGKLDRAALPSPPVARAAADAAPATLPRTPLEVGLARIFAEVLGCAALGIDDDFFDLGGHSLKAMLIASRAAKELSLEIGLRELFRNPTVRRLAAVLAARPPEPPALPPITPAPGERFPLSLPQEQMWRLARVLPPTGLLNLSAQLLVHGPLDAAALARNLDALCRRHAILRTRIAVDGDTPVQVVEPSAEVRLAVVDLDDVPAAERHAHAARFADTEALAPFDLAGVPLARVTLLRLAADAHVLLVTMHHIISDGWSLRVVVDELLRDDAPSPAIQFHDVAAWQRRALADGSFAAQLAYWCHQLTPPLSRARMRPPLSFATAQHRERWDAPVVAALRRLAQREGCTLFVALLAALQIVQARTTGATDARIGTNLANRGRPDTQSLIGLFANTAVLRTDLSGDPTLRDALGRARETALGAYANQDLPFEHLVEALEQDGVISRGDLFQELFLLQGDGAPLASPAGLRIDELRVDEELDVGATVTSCELVWLVRDCGSELRWTVVYKTGTYDADAVGNLLRRVRDVLDRMTVAPTETLAISAGA